MLGGGGGREQRAEVTGGGGGAARGGRRSPVGEEGQVAGPCVCGRRADQRRLRERGAGEDPVAAAAVRHQDCGRDRAGEKEGWKLWALGCFQRRKKG